MRRWIVLVMLFVLPVQFSWAAAASYCQHENDTRRQHVGHHEHQHQPQAKAAKDAASAGQAEVGVNKLPGLDGDCSYCHLAMAQALPAPAARLPFPASASPPDLPTTGWVTHLFERIERPNWQRA